MQSVLPRPRRNALIIMFEDAKIRAADRAREDDIKRECEEAVERALSAPAFQADGGLI